jgi:hypothetical protein
LKEEKTETSQPQKRTRKTEALKIRQKCNKVLNDPAASEGAQDGSQASVEDGGRADERQASAAKTTSVKSYPPCHSRKKISFEMN